MRLHRFLPMAVLCFAAVLGARKAKTIEGSLTWARETIDAHAGTHHFEPPSKSSVSKWQVSKIDGCNMELKETTHRDSADSIFTHEGVFGLSEDRVVTWNFDLRNLYPQFITADTLGAPNLKIFSQGDTFHLKTDLVSRTVRKDGTIVSTSNWSAPGTAQNFWLYFDSPDADNTLLVKRLEIDLRDAVYRCAGRARTH